MLNVNPAHGTPPPAHDPWLARFDGHVMAELANPALDNQLLATRMRISERSLHRKLRSRSGMTPAQYVRQLRMRRAAQLLRAGSYFTVKETAAAVGYQSASYFIEQFRAAFGCTPMAVLQQAGHR